ncbi:hypothetical protein CTheo_7028 [Ceratobasidium theobromae]|uniref:Uncharacterized protein n=1 Tax=Ceratobasidium theobromae TaxID=1582974 RepID=A0A5N5QDL4_9AGAM|nr:hypothetical protein CTheo_7028 [Ceratobasidium theobromae]
MEETKGVTRLANDIDFLNHVIAKHTTSSSVDSQIAGAPRTGLTDDQDAQKIAEDALTILKSFCNSQEELRKVDSDTPGRDWDGKWGRQYMRYREMLQLAQTVAQVGSRYIEEFNSFTPNILGAPKSEVLAMLNKWFEIRAYATQRISQGLLDISGQVLKIHNEFSEFTTEMGARYDREQVMLETQMNVLVDAIAREESDAGKAQQTLDGALAGLTMVGSVFETIFSFGKSDKITKRTTELLEKHTRAAEGSLVTAFRREKEGIARKALELSKERPRLNTIRVVLSTLVHDIADITSRLGRFANLWAAAHSDFLEFQYWVENDYNENLDFLLRKKVEALTSTAAIFAADMNRFASRIVIV